MMYNVHARDMLSIGCETEQAKTSIDKVTDLKSYRNSDIRNPGDRLNTHR